MGTRRSRSNRVAAMLAASAATAALCSGCAGSEPARVPEPLPLVIGTTPVAPIVVAPKVVASPQPPIDEAHGSAPRIFVNSLTTSGKVYVPAGKVVVVHFWATWCGPCKKSFPALQELYTRLRPKGLEVIALSVDDESGGAADFVRAHGTTFPVGWDDDHSISRAYVVDSMPMTYVIDRSGNIAKTLAGYDDGQAHEIEQAVGALF